MSTTHGNKTLEGKQFRLAKYFALASFLVFIIFSLPLSVFVSKEAHNILIKSYENYALLLGENLNYQVFQNFSIPVIRRYGRIRLSDENQSELMDKVVKNTIHSFNIDVVNLYAIEQGIIAYSTNPLLIQNKALETPGYRKALNGEQSSGLISDKKSFWGLGIERIGSEKKIRTYVPFRLVLSTGEDFVAGVFEIIQDITEEYKSIIKFQFLTFGLSTLIMALIFISLILIVRKAERIIKRRASEQLELEEQLHLAERLAVLGEMVAAVSHEIKNPLGIIQSTSELLAGLPDAGETQKRLSAVITEESIRLNNIVTEFLDFARPQEPVLHECRLDEIIHKNISFLGPELERKGIRINNHSDPEKPLRLFADAELLYRAFMNIFINSIQSMNNSGDITVKIEDKNTDYRIDIEDTGKGISPENIKKIFIPFFTTKNKGSGLGLSIVKKIIEGHKGTIGIESREDSGTRVIIHLPKRI